MEVRVRATPNARREIVAHKGTTFTIAVKESASGNAANNRIRMLLAAHFRVPVQRIRFLAGQRSTSKRFEVVQ